MAMRAPSRVSALAIAALVAALPVLVQARSLAMACSRPAPKATHSCCPEGMRPPLQAAAQKCRGEAPCCNVDSAPAQPASQAPVKLSPAGMSAALVGFAIPGPSAAAVSPRTQPGHAPPVLELKADLRI